jgi:drug/metabolite transporter (DMT)-like permease
VRRDGAAAAVALLGVSVVFWGGSFRATAVATEHTSGLVLSALRSIPAALLLAAAVPLLGGRFPQGRVWLWAAVTGLLGVSLFIAGMSEGTDLAGAGNAAVLANTAPFWVLVLGWIFLGERISAYGGAGLVAAFSGVVVMVSSQVGGDRDTRDLGLGIALALAAAVGWAVTTLIVKWMVERDPDVDLVGLTAGQYLVGAAALAVLGFADADGGTDWASGELWLAVAWLAIGASALAYLTFFAALKRASATAVSASLFLVPVVAVAIEAARGDSPGAVVLVGMALAVGGVALVMFAADLEARRGAQSPLPEISP